MFSVGKESLPVRVEVDEGPTVDTVGPVPVDSGRSAKIRWSVKRAARKMGENLPASALEAASSHLLAPVTLRYAHAGTAVSTGISRRDRAINV